MVKTNKKKGRMVNITVNLPEIYDINIQKLKNAKIVASRSEAIRIAIYEFLRQESKNLKLLGIFEEVSGDDVRCQTL